MKANNKVKWLRFLLPLIMLSMIISPMEVSAEVTYSTYTRDNYRALIWTQPVYSPTDVLGRNLSEPDPDNPGETRTTVMRNPQDVFVDAHDHIYVADTGNHRIVHYNAQFEFVRFIRPDADDEGGALRNPQGVFVNDEGEIYIADTGNQRIVHLDREGKFIREIGQPDSRYIPPDYRFDPTKVVLDRRDYMYIATLGGYYGLMQLDPDGHFVSFYGANPTPFSLVDAFKRAVYTREMWYNERSKLPPPVNNVAVGPRGFIYTVTSGEDVEENQIKKINFQGANILTASSESVVGSDEDKKEPLNFAQVVYYRYTDGASDEPDSQVGGSKVIPRLVDAAIDHEGNIITIDSNYKFINQYDSSGKLLFFWGGMNEVSETTQLGQLKNPSSIAVNSNRDLMVLDSQDSVLQIFRLSEFGNLVYTANQLTQNGFYAESEPYWQEVLRLNNLYPPALDGLAKARFQAEDYRKAMEYFQLAGNQVGYSDAYWELRLVWFQRHFSLFATLFLIGAILFMIFDSYVKKRGLLWRNKQKKPSRLPIVQHLRHALYTMKHPIDGFTAIRYDNKGSYPAAIILLVLVYATLVFREFVTSFTFNKGLAIQINALSIFTQFFVIWFAWVICHYLISSIYHGEGRFRDVFIGSAYALTPLIIIGVPLAIVSNVLTLSEGSIYNYVVYAMYFWMGLMFFWKVQSLHSYMVGETVGNILLSSFAMLVLGVLVFIIFGLTNELRIFLFEVYQEVSLR